MVRTVSLGDTRLQLDAMIADVRKTKQPVVVEADGEPVAVVISPEDFARLQDIDVEQLLAIMDRIQERNAHLDPDDVLRDVTEIVEEVRQEMYDERRSSSRGA